MRRFFAFVWCAFFVNEFTSAGVSDVTHEVSKMEGESVTLDPSFIKTKQDRLKWYFNRSLIADLNGDLIKVCAEDQCKERFRDRLKLDIQTGSLTITNTRSTDSGDYQLQINGGKREEIFNVTIRGSLGADTSGLPVFVVGGDSVTLHTGVQTNPNDRIKWYFNTNHIAEIKGDQSKICKYNNCPEGFRERLDLNKQTGSVTVKNITTTDSGDYQLEILNRNIGKTFSVTVLADELDRQKSVRERESVTLETRAKTTPNDVMKWYFNKILIAEITGYQSSIYKDGEEGLKDRLKLDDQTGSLTITNITVKDYGEYTLQISRTTFSISRSFTVTAASVLGTPTISVGEISGIVVVVVLVVAVVGVAVCCCCKKKGGTQANQNDSGAINMESRDKENDVQMSNHDSANQTSESRHNPAQMANGTSHNQDSPLLNNSANQMLRNIPYIDESENE